MNKQFFIWGTIALGVAFLVAGLALVYLGLHTQDEVVGRLREERLEVADPAILLTYEGATAPEGEEVPLVLIDTSAEADAQAMVIHEHTMSATGGLTYAELPREVALADGSIGPNPLRSLYITSVTLQGALHQAHVSLELTLFVMGVGAAFTGLGLYTLVLGLPLVRKVMAMK